MYYEINPPSHIRLGIKELFDYRELFFYFAVRDIQVKYKQTVLGFMWAILQPLLMMAIFTVFFSRVLHATGDDLPYPLFVLSGLILWGLFSNGLMNSSNSMVNNANIIKKIYFPRMIIPLSSILSAFFDFLMSFAVYCIVVFYYSPDINWSLMFVCLPAAILLSVFASLGPGLLLCALNVKYRDFRYVVPFLIQVLLFLTPVIYPMSFIKNDLVKYLLAFNPMSAAISLFRAPLLSSELDFTLIGISILSNVFFLLIGLLYFRKTETFFADIA